MRFIIKFKTAKIFRKINSTCNCTRSKRSFTNSINCTSDCTRRALSLIDIPSKAIDLWG